MKFAFVPTGLLACTALLTACGGGGGDAAPAAAATVVAAPVTKVEGYYAGTAVTGTQSGQFQLLALENDQFYALSGTTDSLGVFRVTSFAEGQGTSANGGYSVPDVRLFSNDGRVVTGSINANFVPKTSISGTASLTTGQSSFSGTAPAASVLAYDTPAALSTVVGTWAATSLYGESVNFSISATGILSATFAGCTYSGLVAPRASGKNVLDVSVTVGPAPCPSAGERYVGIGVTSVLPNGKRQLILAGTNTARTGGTVLFAQR